MGVSESKSLARDRFSGRGLDPRLEADNAVKVESVLHPRSSRLRIGGAGFFSDGPAPEPHFRPSLRALS